MRPIESTDPKLALGLLLARLMTGFIFIMHGYQKLIDNGVDATQNGFAAMGVPLPNISAVALIVLELAGGLALMLGIWSRLAGILLSVSMLGAMYFAHRDAGFFAQDGGFEYVLLLAVISAALALTGPGAWSLEGMLRWSPSAPTIASDRR